MVLAKRWYHTTIICIKENVFTQLKIVKKLEIVYVTTSSYKYYLTSF